MLSESTEYVVLRLGAGENRRQAPAVSSTCLCAKRVPSEWTGKYSVCALANPGSAINTSKDSALIRSEPLTLPHDEHPRTLSSSPTP